MLRIDGETTLELKGFIMDNNQVLISDSDKMGDWAPTVVHITPSMLKFLIRENESVIEKITGATIIPPIGGEWYE